MQFWQVESPLLFRALALVVSLGCATPPFAQVLLEQPKRKLSEYQLFVDGLAQIPSADVLPYDLTTQLFSDYAEKLRFVHMPKGKTALVKDVDEVLEFPIGATLVKTFYYPGPGGTRHIVETRLLRRSEAGWTPLVYLWDADTKEATLVISGTSVKVMLPLSDTGQVLSEQALDTNNVASWKAHEYRVPNLNQCIGCHTLNDTVQPLGPTPRNLNRSYAYKKSDSEDKITNQLDAWAEFGFIDKVSNKVKKSTMSALDNKQASLDDRARAWLAVNCAHCHRRGAPAHSTGLDLRYNNNDLRSIGIYKRPAASGRGSGGHSFAIQPGNASESIMVFRLESEDPAVLMPESGRTIVHEESLQVVKDWIDSLD